MMKKVMKMIPLKSLKKQLLLLLQNQDNNLPRHKLKKHKRVMMMKMMKMKTKKKLNNPLLKLILKNYNNLKVFYL